MCEKAQFPTCDNSSDCTCLLFDITVFFLYYNHLLFFLTSSLLVSRPTTPSLFITFTDLLSYTFCIVHKTQCSFTIIPLTCTLYYVFTYNCRMFVIIIITQMKRIRLVYIAVAKSTTQHNKVSFMKIHITTHLPTESINARQVSDHDKGKAAGTGTLL